MSTNFNQLRSFYFAAKLMSISLAAKKLMVTPAAITMQIKLLEKSLGFNLMFREGRYISLTEQGSSILKKADSVFEHLDELQAHIDGISQGRSEELRIGCHEVPAKYVMPGLIDRFNHLRPNIKVILELGKTPVMLKRVQQHEIPLALVVKKQSDAIFSVKPIVTCELLLVAAKNSNLTSKSEISISELQSLPLVVMEKDSGTEQLVSQHLKAFGVKPNIVMETGSLDMLKDFVLKDRGLAFIETFAMRNQLKKKLFKTIRIKEGSPFIELGICHLKKQELASSTQTFLDLLDETHLNC